MTARRRAFHGDRNEAPGPNLLLGDSASEKKPGPDEGNRIAEPVHTEIAARAAGPGVSKIDAMSQAKARSRQNGPPDNAVVLFGSAARPNEASHLQRLKTPTWMG